MATGDAYRKYVSGQGWQTVEIPAGGGGGAPSGPAGGDLGGTYPDPTVDEGAGLPAWWTVDSTPGSEEVDFAGEVHINPVATNLFGLFIQPDVGFYNNYNAFVRMLDEDGVQFFNLDVGGMDFRAPTVQGASHILLEEQATSRATTVSSRLLSISSALGGRGFSMSSEGGFRMTDFGVPSNGLSNGDVELSFDATAGAPKLKLRCKDVNGDPFDAEIALT